MGQDSGKKRRRSKSRKSGPSIDPEQMSTDLRTAASLMQNYDYLDALSLLEKVETTATQLDDKTLLERCSLMQAEIHVYMGDHQSALRCLLKCPFSTAAARLLSRIALTACSGHMGAQIGRMVMELLATCQSQRSSTSEDTDDGACESTLLMLDCLCRLGDVATIKDYVASIPVTMFHGDRRNARYFQRLMRSITPLMNVVKTLSRDWLKPPKVRPGKVLPYVTLFRQRYIDPSSESCTDSVRRMATCVQHAFLRERTLRLSKRSLYISLLELVRLINDMERYDQDVNECSVRVDFAENAGGAGDSDVSSGIVNLVKERTKRNSKQRCNITAIANAEAPTSQQITRTPRCLTTGYLSLNRSGSHTSSSWRSASPSFMEQKVKRYLYDRLKDHNILWSLADLGLVIFEGMSRYHHLVVQNHERYTVCLCYILYFLCENLKECDDTMSSGRLLLRDFTKDATLLVGSGPTYNRLRQALRRSGVVILSRILDTMKCTPATMRDICAPLSINDPPEFLEYMFKNVSSLLLLECSRGTSMKDIILQARITYIMAKHIIWKHFPKRSGAIIPPRSMRYFIAVRDIVRCLHSLFVLAHSKALSRVTRNIQLKLSLRHRDRRINFHSSLTVGSFEPGVISIERRYVNLLNMLRKYRVKT